MQRSLDRASIEVLKIAESEGIETAWDRFEAQLPQCGFGELGVCCHNCLQGPCRIDPFGEAPQAGVCGATSDTIVARNLARAIAGGSAAHSGHAKHLLHTLLKASQGKAPDYPIKDETKLKSIASRVGIEVEGKDIDVITAALSKAALEEFSERDSPCLWVTGTLTKGRVETFEKLGLMPMGIDSTIAEVMHRTTYGVDADPVNILLGGVKCALADYAGCHLATDISDILFGVPSPAASRANLGVLKPNSVNIAVHGHNPLLSDVIVQVVPELDGEAKAAGADGGINLVGVCCTGNEVLMRHGIPLAANSLSQELVILTGALDAMVVDYQCIMPSLADIAECYHTKLITTMPISKIPKAIHVDFAEEKAKEGARQVIRLAIEAYRSRDSKRVNIPSYEKALLAGFSTEAIIQALSLVNKEDPLKPLIDNIANGNLAGVALFAGCNNIKVMQDQNHITIMRELAKNNVFLLATGCAAGAFARHGMLTPEATKEYAGDGLKGVLTAIGEAAGLGGPLPLVLHLGSCVDNSRAVDIAVALANKLGVDLDKLPVVATAPEATTEKAISIGTWAVALGLPTHLGVVPPVLGSSLVTKVLTESIKDLVGGYFIVETDPVAAAAKLMEAIIDRRRALGLPIAEVKK